jgi:hypothetical protein
VELVRANVEVSLHGRTGSTHESATQSSSQIDLQLWRPALLFACEIAP